MRPVSGGTVASAPRSGHTTQSEKAVGRLVELSKHDRNVHENPELA